MDRTIFLNGRFVGSDEARVSVMDRGFLFTDGVYEVSAVLDGSLVDNDAHLRRLDRSLDAIGIANPYAAGEWAAHQRALIRRNELHEGLVYIQVTRGAAERDFVPHLSLTPAVVMFTQEKRILELPLAATGAAVVTVPDLRWARRDIKAVGLLAQVLAKREAAAVGAAEAFMVDADGTVTEGASSTVFIVSHEGTVATRTLSRTVLPGITRAAVLRLAAQEDLKVEERAFTVAEAQAAAEVFYTSASTFVVPVVSIDGRPVGSSRPGPLSPKLRALYIAVARAEAAA